MTGRYALTYQLRPTVTLYLGNSQSRFSPQARASNSTGATALVGITQTQAQFTTQPSRGWEGGVKASAWRGRIKGTLSYFQMRKYNINTQELIDNVTVIERAGKIKSEGIDTMFTVSPIRMFTLQGDFVWNNGALSGIPHVLLTASRSIVPGTGCLEYRQSNGPSRPSFASAP